MRPSTRAWHLVLLAFVALLGAANVPLGVATAEPPGDRLGAEFEDGAEAPAHGWTQEDGCPARTGASAARPLRGPLERAWKVLATDGAFEGEPLAWKDRVFVVEQAGKRRVLRVLAATNGQERGRLAVDSGAPLFPSVGEGRLLVKTSPTTVEGLSVTGSTLVRRWRIAAKEGIGAPTLLRNEVYLVRDGVLERWAYGASAPTWPKDPAAAEAIRVARDEVPDGAAATPPRYPRPSLRGPSVFVTSGRDLVEVDRATGAESGRASLDGDVDPESSRVVVGWTDVFVRRGSRPPGEGADTLRVGRNAPGAFFPRDGLSFPVGFATVGLAWVGVVEADGKRRLCTNAGEEAIALAGEGLHDEFLTAAPPTMVPGVVYAGLCAFAYPSLTVLRASPPAVASRAVPLRDRLVVLESRTIVAAWREAGADDERPLLGVPKGGTGAVAFKGCRAALDDGRILEGPFSFDPKKNVFRSTKPGELASCPARAVAAVLTNDAPRCLVFACAPADAASGVAAIVRAETARAVLALVAEAGAAGDIDLARRAVANAVELGALDADVAKADAQVAALEAAPPPRDEAKAAEVEARLAALQSREADALVEVAEATGKDAPSDFAVALVRAALHRDPAHEAAARWVRSRLPKDLPLGEDPLRVDEWLDFVEVRGRLKVRVWGYDKATEKVWGSDGEPPATDTQAWKAYWDARTTWPADVDVVAFECGPLVVVCPIDRPGTIVRCLALGRLVADTLDETFKPMGPPMTYKEAMVLKLFSTQKEYLEESRPGGEADRSDGLENTAGHYDPGDNVTRMYFPGDEDSGEIPGVYAHELTHHWIERRRPGPDGPFSGGHSTSSTPGYWVVEGFADFVKGFVFDVDRRRAHPENPRADYVDVLSTIPPEALIPWPSLLTLTQEDFSRLSITDVVRFPRRFHLGPEGGTVPKVLFYDQGAAVCAYLYLAEGQKHRKALLDYLYAYYTGKAKPDTLSRSTGLSPEELGKRVVAWCKELAKKG